MLKWLKSDESTVELDVLLVQAVSRIRPLCYVVRLVLLQKYIAQRVASATGYWLLAIGILLLYNLQPTYNHSLELTTCGLLTSLLRIGLLTIVH